MGVPFPAGKTNKSFTKRFRVTRKGKVLARKAGQNHFNAKQSRTKQLKANRGQQIDFPHKALLQYKQK